MEKTELKHKKETKTHDPSNKKFEINKQYLWVKVKQDFISETFHN